ncbi:hypothetical protein [Cupriavidus sp. CuC1]|uniref:hypothetical protein n=1 Tax=Cupriavidus sp. CuC1 TaxID=3373131 RepID=UPI0037CEBB57
MPNDFPLGTRSASSLLNSPHVSVSHFDGPDDHARELRQFNQQYLQIGPGRFAPAGALSTNLVQGVANHIKVIKRLVCGFGTDRYFFFKTRAAFPGNR